MNTRRSSARLAAACLLVALASAAHAADAPQVFDFAVDVDGHAVGSHRFEVRKLDDGSLAVQSRAGFVYRLLGITLYRYSHEADETWRDGCLQELRAHTDDNGKRRDVHAEPGGKPGCVHSFAYWDPQSLAVSRLLNPQTGALDEAQLVEVGSDQLTMLNGRSVTARESRLTAGGLQIDLWYGPAGEWLQLESTTTQGKRLRYRLR